jgi:hypothetical protein
MRETKSNAGFVGVECVKAPTVAGEMSLEGDRGRQEVDTKLGIQSVSRRRQVSHGGSRGKEMVKNVSDGAGQRQPENPE